MSISGKGNWEVEAEGLWGPMPFPDEAPEVPDLSLLLQSRSLSWFHLVPTPRLPLVLFHFAYVSSGL